MPRPKTYTDADRPGLVAVAADLIADGGVDVLSVRRVAAGAGVSTTAIYALFGSRDALVAEVVRMAVESFREVQAAARSGVDAAEALRGLGVAYRTWALGNPSLYEVIFAGRVPVEFLRDTARAMDPLVEVLGELAGEGRLVGDDARRAAMAVWSGVHGAVSLELALWPDRPREERDERYADVLAAIERAWLRPARG